MYAVDTSSARSRRQPPAGPPGPSHTHRRRRTRRNGSGVPLLLALPALLALAGIEGYPLIHMLALSFQDMQLRQLFAGLPAPWVGLDNYVKVLSDGDFWAVVLHTVYFTVVSVAATVVIGLGVALLMRRVAHGVKIAMIVAMMFVWAIPQLVATQIFRWLTDADFGVVNYLIDRIPGVDFTNHSWFATPLQGWAVITTLVVWAGIPFIAITLNAGLTQVPKELLEAATVDGATPWQALRNITLPILRPLIVIVTTLSVIWNFGLFTQVWVIRDGKPEPPYQTLGTYAYSVAFKNNHYSLGSAISVITVLLLLVAMALYVRQMFRIGDAD
jgi:N,N'-diacetylchitobiose transport system permease protein